MKKIKEPMPPSKKMQKPGKKVSGMKYSMDKEEYDEKMKKKPKKANMMAMDLMLAKEGYSKKPRLKAEKKKPMGR